MSKIPKKKETTFAFLPVSKLRQVISPCLGTEFFLLSVTLPPVVGSPEITCNKRPSTNSRDTEVRIGKKDRRNR